MSSEKPRRGSSIKVAAILIGILILSCLWDEIEEEERVLDRVERRLRERGRLG